MRTPSTPPLAARTRAARRLLAAGLGALALAGCNDFLTVDNPAAIQEPNLEAVSYVTLLSNSVLGEFQPMVPQVAMYSGVYGDELRNNHVFFENRLIDLRQVAPDNGTYGIIYNAMQRTRYMADTAAGRMRQLLGDTAARDMRIARAVAIAGYTYTIMGERLCAAPINGGAPVAWQGLLDTAMVRFDAAITAASAVRGDTSRPASQRALADTVFFLAKVGGSRAALMRNQPARARTYATGVPAAWEYRLNYSTNSPRENNPFNAWTLNAANTIFSYEAKWWRTNDPRLPHAAVPVAPAAANTQNGERAAVPAVTAPWGGFANTATGAVWALNASMRLASGLEAAYVLAETDGPVATTLTFVNQRRAAGLQPAVTLSGDALMAELREQRARDFFLDGRRLGDIRRYLEYNNIDFFPRGAYPGSTTGEAYGPQTCMPLTNNEIFGNPNVPR